MLVEALETVSPLSPSCQACVRIKGIEPSPPDPALNGIQTLGRLWNSRPESIGEGALVARL